MYIATQGWSDKLDAIGRVSLSCSMTMIHCLLATPLQQLHDRRVL